VPTSPASPGEPWPPHAERQPWLHSSYGVSLSLPSGDPIRNFYAQRSSDSQPHGWGGWTRLEHYAGLPWNTYLHLGWQFSVEYYRGVPFESSIESSLLSFMTFGRLALGWQLASERFRVHGIVLGGWRFSSVHVWSAEDPAPALQGEDWNRMGGVGIGIGGKLRPKQFEWSLSVDHRWSSRARFDEDDAGAVTVLPSVRVRAFYVEAGLGFSLY
jgi:hypothetical protein